MNNTRINDEFGRLDERLEALIREFHRYEASEGLAKKVAFDEIARRLVELNHAHAEAKSVLYTYITRDVYERDKKEGETRLSLLENAAANLAGKLWVPMLIVAGIAAGIAVAVVKIFLP